jgi:hypothetical protein
MLDLVLTISIDWELTSLQGTCKLEGQDMLQILHEYRSAESTASLFRNSEDDDGAEDGDGENVHSSIK